MKKNIPSLPFTTLIIVCFSYFFNTPIASTQSTTSNTKGVHLNQIADSLYKQEKYIQSTKTALQALAIHQEQQSWQAAIESLLILDKNEAAKGNSTLQINYLNHAINIAEKHLSQTDTLIAYIYIAKGDLYTGTQIDSSIYYYSQALLSCESNQLWEQLAHIYLGIGTNYYYQQDFEKMEKELNTSLSIVQKYLSPQSSLLPIIYINLGALYQILGEYDKSITVFEKSLNLELNHNPIDSFIVATNYQNLAYAYRVKGDNELAIQFNEHALSIYQSLPDNTDEDIRQILNTMGRTYKLMGDNKKAINFLKKSISFTDKIFAATYNNLATSYWELEKYDSSLFFLHKNYDDKQKQIENTYRNIGKTYFYLQQYHKALDTLQLAQAIAIEKYGQNYYRHAMRYNDIGETYAALKQDEKALHHYQKALTLLQKEFSDTSIYTNPPLKNIYSKNRLLNTLNLKAKSLNALYYQNPSNQKHLQTAHATYHLATQLIDTIRQDYIGQGSKQLLAKQAIAIYEGAIQTALALYAQTKDIQYQQQAFYYAEKNKALLLLEAMKESQAKLFANLPDSLLQKEDSLKKNLTFYETKLLTEKQRKAPDSLKIATWKDKIFNLKRDYENLQATLENNYADYYQLKYNLSVAEIPSLQQTLDTLANTALIEYFVGDSNIFVFAITPDSFNTYKIDKPTNFENQIYTFRKLLKKDTLKTNLQQAYELYTKTAHQLYQTLLSDALANLNPNIQKLIIIPDGQLGYIPFEALVSQITDSQKASYKRKHTHYLIQDYQSSYAYSTTLLLEGLHKKRTTQATQYFGGFAPEFSIENGIAAQMDCSDAPLQALIHSQPSVSNIQSLLGGTAYLANEAIKANFLKQSSRYRILHLSTHACVNDEEPMLNSIFFTDSSLLTYELYNMQFNADLAVLSACNTGSGKLVRGEGIMSLSRAFTYAGCPSIVTSLWTANDSITAFVMEQFYHHLDQGETKDQALRNAKLALLQHPDLDNTIAHPFYWATFVHIGNPAPILREKSWWLYALFAFCAAGIGVFLFRRK